MLKLGVNIDHVATVRQARRAERPDPVEAALLAEAAGADGITAHLREDRRHIQDADMERLARRVKKLNMEMAVSEEMIVIASRLRPHDCCLVPEKRQELTTEGGLDVVGRTSAIRDASRRLADAGVCVSLFIDPDLDQIKAAAETGAPFIELHTGAYANHPAARQAELERLIAAAELAHSLGLKVNAGHGIDYDNMDGILKIPRLVELNIGHSIVGRAIMVGMERAVREMLALTRKYSG